MPLAAYCDVLLYTYSLLRTLIMRVKKILYNGKVEETADMEAKWWQQWLQSFRVRAYFTLHKRWPMAFVPLSDDSWNQPIDYEDRSKWKPLWRSDWLENMAFGWGFDFPFSGQEENMEAEAR